MLRKTKCILTAPRVGATACHVGKDTGAVRKQKTAARGKLRPEPVGGPPWEGLAKQSEQFRIG